MFKKRFRNLTTQTHFNSTNTRYYLVNSEVRTLGAKKTERQHNDEHSHSNRELEEISRNLAHEINSPLSIIKLHAENIHDDSIDSEELARFKKSAIGIINNVDRITKIIKAVRSYSQDNFKVPFLPVSVEKLFKEALNEVHPRLEEHQINVRILNPEEDIKVSCRQVEIHQILSNLLRNSIEAIRESDNPWIQIQAEELNEKIIIRMTDSGQGIPEELQAQIFQPLFSTKPRKDNSGVGLALCSKIAKVHSGNLKLDNDSPNTSFVLELPINQKSVFGEIDEKD